MSKEQNPKEGKTPKKSKVKLVSYTLKAIIPTGMYANIQPEITVEADDLEQANNYVMPYITELFSLFSEGKGLDKPPAINSGAQASAPSTSGTTAKTPEATTVATQTTSSASFNKATQAINSCTSGDALNLIVNQIFKSVKLNDEEKKVLLDIAAVKTAEFNGTGE